MDTLHGHRHSPPGQHEHEFEPQHGLPEPLPPGERILWQGAPDWWTLAVRRFHVRKLIIYFAALLGARLISLAGDGMPWLSALHASALQILASVICIGLVSLIAWLAARTTLYTLTDRRMVMRIGIVLTITLNLPFKRVEAADLKLGSGGVGDISLRLNKADHMAYLHLWPHARPWRVRRPEPTLLCLPQAQAVAEQLCEAWQAVQAGTAAADASAAAQARPSTAGQVHGTGPAVAPQLAVR